MRAAAILGPGVPEKALRPFHAPVVELEVLDKPQAGYECVLLFGGDGTVHRHLPALLEAQAPLLVVPAGSGNDFARALGLGTLEAAVAAWRRFCAAAGNIRRIDVGVITPIDKENTHEEGTSAAKAGSGASFNGAAKAAPFHRKTQLQSSSSDEAARIQQALEATAGNWKLEARNFYFVCVAGAGLDAAVNRLANRMPRWLRGAGGYILALPPALLRFGPQRFTVEIIDANPGPSTRFCEPAMMAAFGNAPSYGHGMRIAPRAELADGKLDVCLVRRLAKLRLLRLFPVVFSGAHLGMREVEYFQATAIRLSTETPLDIYADGEFVCRTPAEIRVLPRRLAVVVP